MGGITQLFVAKNIAWPGRKSAGMHQEINNTRKITTTISKLFIAPPVLVVPLDQERNNSIFKSADATPDNVSELSYSSSTTDTDNTLSVLEEDEDDYSASFKPAKFSFDVWDQ